MDLVSGEMVAGEPGSDRVCGPVAVAVGVALRGGRVPESVPAGRVRMLSRPQLLRAAAWPPILLRALRRRAGDLRLWPTRESSVELSW
jgi:hypothetical protein